MCERWITSILLTCRCTDYFRNAQVYCQNAPHLQWRAYTVAQHLDVTPGWGVSFSFWLQCFCIFHEHLITCGEPVYPLGNFTSLLVIDQSDQFQTCFCISVWDKSINPPLEEHGLWFVQQRPDLCKHNNKTQLMGVLRRISLDRKQKILQLILNTGILLVSEHIRGSLWVDINQALQHVSEF